MPSPLRIEPAGRDLDATERAGEVAASQWGAIGRPQLLAVGFSTSRIGRWVEMRRLFPRYPGVYAWGRPDLPLEGELAAGLVFTGTGSGLDGISALWWQEVVDKRPPKIHIASPGRRASCADLVIRHPRTIDRHVHRELPVVDLASALLAATPYLDDRELRIALANADFHGLLHLPSLQAACASGPKGSKRLRRAMGRHLPQLARCRNDFEIDFVLLCEEHGLPIPEPNVRKGRYVPDMTWEAHKLIVELDGKDGHSSPAQIAHDADRQRWLEARGYLVIRFTWAEVYFSPRSVLARLQPHLPR